MLVSVNYHYVGMGETPFSGIHGLSIQEFIRHVEWLRARFRLLGVADLFELIEKGCVSEPSCVITFDDGLRCHYEPIYRIAREKNIPIIFFVSAGPLHDGKATLVHKSQYLRAHTSPLDISQHLESFLMDKAIDLDDLDNDKVIAHYRYDDLNVAKVKFVLNYVLSEAQRREFIDQRFSELVPDERRFCREWYLTEEEVKTMHCEMNCIGSHAWSHSPLGTLEEGDAKNELLRSREILECVTGREVLGVSYPLGNEMAVSGRESVLAAEVGYRFGFTMEREVNRTLDDPLKLARLDCNDLPSVGKKPMFSEHEAGWVHHDRDQRLSGRRRYILES